MGGAAKVADGEEMQDNKQGELGIKPNGYVDQGTDEDTGHGRKKFEGQSIHGDTVRANKHENKNAVLRLTRRCAFSTIS